MIGKIKKYLLVISVLIISILYKNTAYADELVVVLDPGHGGEALGGNTDEYIEKELTLKVAYAMAEELSKYDGIKVYLTRDSDKDLSLENRVKVAKNVNADYFFCLHFNMSEYHTLFGSECWISAFGSNYTQGYDFSTIEMEELKALGCFSRGIKTRMGQQGNDYYGIIRMCTKNDIPSVIIEHCYLDHVADSELIDHDSWPQKYGVADATAVAKYFRLKSDVLGVDYSDYEYASVGLPPYVMKPDSTAPENLTITSCEVDEETGIATIKFSAAEMESKLLYYSFSFDGGESFFPYEVWPDGETEATATIQLPYNAAVSVVVKVANNYDLSTNSEVMYFPAISYGDEEEEIVEEEVEIAEQKPGIISFFKKTFVAVDEQNAIEKPQKNVVVLVILFISGVLFTLIAIKLLKK